MLFPIVDVRVRKPLEWRGTLKPASWTLWWRSYRRFILHYAKLATAGATMLCVGSELVSTEHMRDRWRRLIDEVRGVYQGRLLYSANWDHYEPVSFWDLVNLVGLTAYYSLTSSREATETQMLDEWVDVRDQLVDWSRRVGRRIVFTEVGYPSIDGAAVYPWDYTRGGKSDPEEQRRAYRSFTRAWTGVQNLAGVFFWNWYGEGGITDTNYTPRNKPAQNVVKRWFSQFRAIRPNSPKLEPSGARFSDE